MNILIFFPMFNSKAGVSALRANSFYHYLSLKHKVQIMTFGDVTDMKNDIMTIEQNLFSSFVKTILSRKKITKILLPSLSGYDCIFVSAPPYGLYEVGSIASSLNIPVIYDYRDQPDLIYYEKTRNKKWLKPIRWVMLKLLETYIYSRFKSAYAILCAGQMSAALLQDKFKKSSNIYNVGNGFEKKDLELVKSFHTEMKSDGIIIGWGGSIYDFRDTDDLRQLIYTLDSISDRRPTTIKHWGKLSPALKKYIGQMKSLKYEYHEPISREIYLKELSQVDVFLLACSDTLIWEPTTTVYDYILFNKPVLYCGLNNNEAYNTMQKAGLSVFKPMDVTEKFIETIEIYNSKTNECNKIFSREAQYAGLDRLLNRLESSLSC